MALKKCKECGHDVSSKADTCPHCGFKNKPKQFGCGAFLLILFVVSILISFINQSLDDSAAAKQRAIEAQERIEQQRAKQREQQQAKKQQLTLFTEKREIIIQQITELINDGKQGEAEDILKGFSLVDDPALVSFKNKLREKTLLEKVAKIPASNFQANRNIYRQLVKLNPNNESYQKKLDHYQGKLDAIAAKQRAQEAKATKERQQRLAKFGEPPVISSWDGSYLEVTKYLKRVANDPDSIDIDGCTKVYHTESGWLVGCDYRGKNAFGGIVRNSNWFTIVHGAVIQVHDSSDFNP